MTQVDRYGYSDKQCKLSIRPSLDKFLLHKEHKRVGECRYMGTYYRQGNTRIVTYLRSMLSCLVDRLLLDLNHLDSNILSHRQNMFLDLGLNRFPEGKEFQKLNLLDNSSPPSMSSRLSIQSTLLYVCLVYRQGKVLGRQFDHRQDSSSQLGTLHSRTVSHC